MPYPGKIATIKETLLASGAGSDTHTTALINGNVLHIFVDYSAGSSANTHLTIADNASQTLASLVDTATDVHIYPCTGVTTNAGVALTYDATRPIYERGVYVNSPLTITMINNTAAETVAITIVYEMR